jgi:hypothetical protein
MKTPREKHNDAETARLKRLAIAAGYKGMQGGWIYKATTKTGTYYAADMVTVETRTVDAWKPVAQGWAHFETLFAKKLGFVRVPFGSGS